MSVGIEEKRGRRIIRDRKRLQRFRALMQRRNQWINRDHFLADALREVVERNRPKATLCECESARDSLDARKIDNDRVAT